MEKEINQEKLCGNCRYYLEHYIKQNTNYRKILCGHCTNRNYFDGRKKRPLETCEYWETVEIKKEERKKRIKETLEFMAESLNQIVLILKDDEENCP